MTRRANPTDGFGAVLRGIRKDLGLTLDGLSDLVGLSPAYLSKLENNAIGIPPVHTIQQIARYTGVDEAYLLDAASLIPEWVLEAYYESPAEFQAFAMLAPKARKAALERPRTFNKGTRKKKSKKTSDATPRMTPEQARRLKNRLMK